MFCDECRSTKFVASPRAMAPLDEPAEEVVLYELTCAHGHAVIVAGSIWIDGGAMDPPSEGESG